MTLQEFCDFYEEHEDEFLEFRRVKNKFSNRPDLHGFILLDKLVPATGKDDIVICAEHDEIWLGIDVEELLKVATSDQLIELFRCGIMFDSTTESLKSFV